jgi:DNA/RNA-binding domain of Phe-tRNA-synthetase-like protein
MSLFSYDPAVLAAFPTIRASAIHASGLTNGPAPDDVRAAFVAEQRATIERIGGTPLSDLPSLAAWRRVFSRFGVAPTQYRSAAEALLRRLTKRGDIPSINLLVDLANLASIRYGLPIAVFDQTPVHGSTVVRFADGGERFTDLGSGEIGQPPPGEVIFVDDDGLVSARRWCWRQSRESAAGPATTDVLITIEGHHDGATTAVASASHDLIELLELHATPASVTSAQLSPATPRFE